MRQYNAVVHSLVHHRGLHCSLQVRRVIILNMCEPHKAIAPYVLQLHQVNALKVFVKTFFGRSNSQLKRDAGTQL